MNKLLTKRIIIISSNDEKVGTQSDVKNYIKFFTSPFGGCWDEKEEIKKIYKLDDLQRELIIAHCIQCEYIICIFTGHGRWNGASTELKLASGEIIDEKHLHGLAAWQLTILDCCRKAGEAPRGLVKNVEKLYEGYEVSTQDKEKIRTEYDRLIRETPINCEYCLYACRRGEGANGFPEFGGLFSRHLIEAGQQVLNMNDGICRIGKACKTARKSCMSIVGRTNELNSVINNGINVLEKQTPTMHVYGHGCKPCEGDKQLVWSFYPSSVRIIPD